MNNNIEKDIKKINVFLLAMKSDFRTGLGYKDELQAIENILANIERLEKEKNIHKELEQQYKKDYLDIKNKYDSLLEEIQKKIVEKKKK